MLFACQQEPQKEDAPHKILEDNYDKAGSFFYKNNDSAFYYYSQVPAHSKDTAKIARAYSYMAVIQHDAGDYFGSIESSLSALALLSETSEKDKNFIVSNFNEIALNNLRLKNYTEALKYYDLTLKYAQDNEYRLVVQNNKALAYRAQKNYVQALTIYRGILSKKTLSKKEYARALTNMSFAKWLQNPTYNAAKELRKALHIREVEKDLWGQNSSYAHLADYYMERRADSALYYARRMFAVAKQLNSANDQMEALQKLIKLSPTDSIKGYFEKYQYLSDSVQSARNTAKNQFALIRYETEKHKADNLTLQQDNTRKRYQIIKQRIALLSILCLVIIAGTFSIVWYKKRKQRVELEAQNRIKENQLSISKKVHDVVANGLYRVMTEIENQQHINREGILDRLENMYEKSRDISYEREEIPAKTQHFNEKIAALLRSFATASTKVIIAGNELALWENLNQQAKQEVEHVLQELMVNMKKHSQATDVALRFEQIGKQLHIYYTDNGIGVKEGFRYNNGLTNTGNRIKSIDGEIIFDTEVERGVKIHISFPLS